MLRVPAVASLLSFVVLAGTAVWAQDPPPANRESGIRGHVVIAADLQAATEVAVGPDRAKTMRTPAHVRRPRGRKLQPLVEPMPDILVVLEGEDVRVDNASPPTMTITGMRFVPGQVLLTHTGPIAVTNKQDQAVTILDGDNVVDTIGAGETKQVTMSTGVHTLSMRELPYARASVKVLERGRVLTIDNNGDIPFVGAVEGDYFLSFWLGVGELHRREFHVARNGLSYIDATVSANTVVDVNIRDASDRFVAPPSPTPTAPAAPPAPPAPVETPQ